MRCGASRKKPSRDSTPKYSPEWFTCRDVPQIAAYREKLISCQKGLDLVPSRNWPGWGCTWRTSPFGTMSLVPKMTTYHKKLKEWFNHPKHYPGDNTRNNDIKELSPKKGVENPTVFAGDNIFKTGIHSYTDKGEGEEEG